MGACAFTSFTSHHTHLHYLARFCQSRIHIYVQINMFYCDINCFVHRIERTSMANPNWNALILRLSIVDALLLHDFFFAFKCVHRKIALAEFTNWFTCLKCINQLLPSFHIDENWNPYEKTPNSLHPRISQTKCRAIVISAAFHSTFDVI